MTNRKRVLVINDVSNEAKNLRQESACPLYKGNIIMVLSYTQLYQANCLGVQSNFRAHRFFPVTQLGK